MQEFGSVMTDEMENEILPLDLPLSRLFLSGQCITCDYASFGTQPGSMFQTSGALWLDEQVHRFSASFAFVKDHLHLPSDSCSPQSMNEFFPDIVPYINFQCFHLFSPSHCNRAKSSVKRLCKHGQRWAASPEKYWQVFQ